MSRKLLLPLMTGAFLCPALFAQARGGAALPDGAGKEIVQGACGACHSLNNVASAGHTREEWQTVVAQMRNAGAKVPDDQVPAILDYLSKNLPEKPPIPAVIIPGSVKVNIKEWTVPTPGARPHDPLAARDGTIWFSGHMANIVGHLDPKNGEFTEYHHPKVAASGPRGIVEDKDGNIWFTANFKGYIGKFQPQDPVESYRIQTAARGSRSAHADVR